MLGFLASFMLFSAIAAEDPAETSKQKQICINEETYHGCCSHKDGALGYAHGKLICKNREFSPTCKAKFKTKLTGCCSGYSGVDYTDFNTGAVHCNNQKKSPSCKVELKRNCSEPEVG